MAYYTYALMVTPSQTVPFSSGWMVCAKPGPVSVRRKVLRDGVIVVTRERLRVGVTYAGKIVTVHVEDTYFRVTCDGAGISLHPRPERRRVTRWKARIRTPRTGPVTRSWRG